MALEIPERMAEKEARSAAWRSYSRHMKLRLCICVIVLLASLVTVATAMAGYSSYLTSGQGPGIPGDPRQQAGSYSGGVIMYDVFNLTRVPYWRSIDRGAFDTAPYCQKAIPGFYAANGAPRSPVGATAKKVNAYRSLCAHRVASRLLAAPVSGNAPSKNPNLSKVCTTQARRKARSVCWYNERTPYGVPQDDSELHTRYEANRVAVGPTGVLAMNVVVWRLDTLSTEAQRIALRGYGGNVTSFNEPVFERRIGAFKDGGSYKADLRFGADERSCAPEPAAICWGANEGPGGKGSDSSRQSWWHGGNPAAGANDDSFGAAGSTWRNSTPHGGPLDGRAANENCVNDSVRSNLRNQWESYSDFDTHSAANVWRDGWTTLDYVFDGRPPQPVDKERAWNACVWKTAAAPYYPYYPYNIAHTGTECKLTIKPCVNSYRAPGVSQGGGFAPAKQGKQFESVALGWTMPKHSSPQVRVRIEGIPGTVYLVQIYGLNSREGIESTSIDAFISPGPVGGGTPEVCPSCDDGTDPDDPTTGTPPGEGLPPTSLPPESDGGEFPVPRISLEASKQIVRTGDPVTWTATAENRAPLTDEQAMFVTGGIFRLGEPQIDGDQWSQTVNDQKYYDAQDPEAGRFKIKSPTGGPGAIGFASINWPFPSVAPLAQIRQVLTSFVDVPQNGLADFDGNEPLWNAKFLTSSLLPSQNEDEPQIADAGVQYESGRWYENEAAPPAGICSNADAQPVYRYPRAGGESIWQVDRGVSEGYYYHNGDDECLIGGATTPVTFGIRINGPVPANTKLTIQSRDIVDVVDGVEIPAWTRTVTAGSALAPIIDDAGRPGVKIVYFTATGANKLPDEDGAYRIIADLPTGTQWRMYTSRRSDPADQIQWAGHSQFAIPGIDGVLGPGYDPLSPEEPLTAAPCGAALTAVGNLAGFGRCGEYSDFRSLLILGNQPSH